MGGTLMKERQAVMGATTDLDFAIRYVCRSGHVGE